MKILLLGADGQLGYELHRTCAPLGDILPYTYSGKLSGRQACGQVDFGVAGLVGQAEHGVGVIALQLEPVGVEGVPDQQADHGPQGGIAAKQGGAGEKA